MICSYFKWKEIIKTIFFALMVGNASVYCKSAVTYTFSFGRFGDHLAAYCHAKWVSYKFDLPLLYKPFLFSDYLKLHDLEKNKYSEYKIKKFSQVIYLDPTKDNVIDKNSNILYVVPYFAESHLDYEIDWKTKTIGYPFPVDWKDENFLKIIREYVAPRFNINQFELPRDCITVAVHVRRGTGFDPDDLKTNLPHKSSPDSYYIEQIKRIAEIYSDKKVYIFIFTDHDKPIELVEFYKKEVNKENLVFDCKNSVNISNQEVLEDFFMLSKFDCLIRSTSHFSLMASKLGNYKVQISPYRITKVRNCIIIDQVKYEVSFVS